MIEFVDVVRCYGKKTAVDHLSMSVGAGEVFAFLGPNGAGKTTTIKMMVGLLLPNSGRVEVSGYDVVAQPRLANQNCTTSYPVVSSCSLWPACTGCPLPRPRRRSRRIRIRSS